MIFIFLDSIVYNSRVCNVLYVSILIIILVPYMEISKFVSKLNFSFCYAMATDYCDRSTELLLCAQLLHQKVMSGRIILKPRRSHPDGLNNYFSSTLYKTQLIPLLHQSSTSLSLSQAKMDQLQDLAERYTNSPTPDTLLAASISTLVQKLQPEVVAVSSLLKHGVSNKVLQEFAGRPQICKHVKALVASQEARLAELSRRFRDFIEANKMTISEQFQQPPSQIPHLPLSITYSTSPSTTNAYSFPANQSLVRDVAQSSEILRVII